MATYKEELANWLKTYHWDYFITVTCRYPRKDPIAFMRDVWQELAPFPADLVADRQAERAFLACEPFRTHHDLHTHGLVYGSGLDLPWNVQSALERRFGRSRVEIARSLSQVSAYCSNYVTKDHRADNWNLFGSWQ